MVHTARVGHGPLEYFRKYVSEDQWKISLGRHRKPLGKVLSMKVINSTYYTALPGAPDGQYVVIQFETSFENKHNAVETVTPNDGVEQPVAGFRLLYQMKGDG